MCIFAAKSETKGAVVPRGFLQAASKTKTVAQPTIAAGRSGRLELAEWVASSDNPLTSRVMVNRIWHHLIGKGLVRTTDNFGMMGEKPSHAVLLDWLAHQFVVDQWSVKKMIRRIVMSRTYRLASTGESVGGVARSGEPPDLARQPQAAYSRGDPGLDSIGERTIKHATGWPHDSQIFAV